MSTLLLQDTTVSLRQPFQQLPDCSPTSSPCTYSCILHLATTEVSSTHKSDSSPPCLLNTLYCSPSPWLPALQSPLAWLSSPLPELQPPGPHFSFLHVPGLPASGPLHMLFLPAHSFLLVCPSLSFTPCFQHQVLGDAFPDSTGWVRIQSQSPCLQRSYLVCSKVFISSLA